MTTLPGVEVEVRMIGHPRLDALIHPSQQIGVLLAVSPHDAPRLRIAVDAAPPQSRPGVRYLAPLVEIAPDVVKFVAVELERPSRSLQCVDRLERTGRREPVCYQPRINLFDVEGIAVVRADYICIVHETMQHAA